MFRLLTPTPERPVPGLPAVLIAGDRWAATSYDAVPERGAAPPYTCVSYSWGSGQVPNPFVPGSTMSSRTLPALEMTVRMLRPQAIWVDALCVPPLEPARTACLRSMGAIYSAASQVAAILSHESSGVLTQSAAGGDVDEETLLLLEKDAWVSRAWTYQEMVNASDVKFIAEAGSTAAVGAEDFLNKVGHAIDRFKKAHRCSTVAFRASYPRLDSLEDLIADWRTAGYLERTAYQAMSSLDRRLSLRPDDHFNAMLGAITTTLPEEDDLRLSAAENFMRVCEAKRDFSFIYSSDPRSNAPGRRWRPLPGQLPALLPWHTYGDGQGGELYATHLELHGMCATEPGSMTPEAGETVAAWRDSEQSETGAPQVRVLEQLRLAGFSGHHEPIELTCGYFFPQHPLRTGDDAAIFIAGGLRWVHGAPGLLATRAAGERWRYLDVGVLVGKTPQATRTLELE